MDFDIYGRSFASNDIDDENGFAGYLDALLDLFVESPEGQARLAVDPEMGFWVARFVDYGYIYNGVLPPEYSDAEVDELLFEIFPRKVSASSPDELADVLPELIAFWEFLKRAFELPNADEVLTCLRATDFDEFRDEMLEPSNFGMAKSFVMAGHEAGFDMANQEGLNAFMHLQNAAARMDLRGEGPDFPALDPSPGKSRSSSASKNKRKMVKASRKKNRSKKKKKK